MSHNVTALHQPADGLRIQPLTAPLGAEIHNLDARVDPTPEQVLALKQALRDHHILIFKRQQLDDAQFLRFTSWPTPCHRLQSSQQHLFRFQFDLLDPLPQRRQPSILLRRIAPALTQRTQRHYHFLAPLPRSTFQRAHPRWREGHASASQPGRSEQQADIRTAFLQGQASRLNPRAGVEFQRIRPDIIRHRAPTAIARRS